MRVVCGTVDEFLECLAEEQEVFQSAIRVNIARRPIGESNPRVALKFGVVFQASAVVLVGGTSEYLLEVGVMCGTDYEDDTQEKEGSEAARAFKQQIDEYAKSRSWKVLPGVIGL